MDTEVTEALAVLGRPPTDSELLTTGWHGDTVHVVGRGRDRSVLRVYRLGAERRWEDRRPLALDRLEAQAEVARLLAGYGDPPEPDGLAPTLWLVGCTNANSALAVRTTAPAARASVLDGLRRRADDLAALV